MAQYDAEIVNSLHALMARAKQTESGIKATDKAVAELNKRLKATDPRMLAQAAKEAKELQRGFDKASGAIGKMGGPLGEMLNRLTGSQGVGGGLARVAATAALAGFAMRTFMTVVGANVARARDAAQAFREMSDAMRSGQNVERSQALGALGQKKEMALLHSMGGMEAVRAANEVAETGHMDGGAARRGVAKAYQISNSATRNAAIEAAINVAEAGGDFEQAIDSIVGDKRMQRRLWKDGEVTDDSVAEVTNRVFSAQVGRKYNKAQDRYLARGQMFNRFGREAAATQAVVNQKDVVARDQLEAQGQAAAREDLAKFSAPVAAAITELARARQQELDALDKMAKAEGNLAAAIANIGMMFGGEGSATQQGRRKRRAFGDGG